MESRWIGKRTALLMAIAWMAGGRPGETGEIRANAQGSQDYPFAMCSNGNMLTSPQYASKMLDAGARMWRGDVTFGAVRPKASDDPDQWDWSLLESIRRLRQQHPQLEVLPLLGYSAAWADDPNFGRAGSRGVAAQRGVDLLPAWDAKNLYGHYVYETVRRYKDITHVWESWNEPDLPDHSFFKGNGKQFFPYQKACYLAAKHADPNCKVLFAAMCFASVEGYLGAHNLKAPTPSPPSTSFFEEYLQACAQDPNAKKNHYYFDIMNQHTYSRATDLYDYSQICRKLMRETIHEEKPIWITEMGFPDDSGVFGGNADDYCDYILQSFAWAALAGVQRLFHFQLDNSNGHGLYTGLLGEPKPALITYRDLLTKEFADAKFVTQLHGNRGVGLLEGKSPYARVGRAGYALFEFRSIRGNRRLLMAFTDTDQAVTAQIPSKRPQAILIDRHNHRTPLTAKNGFYKVLLPGATNRAGWPILDDPKAKALGEPEHLVGGATMVILEG